jgi:hypothetical protein
MKYIISLVLLTSYLFAVSNDAEPNKKLEEIFDIHNFFVVTGIAMSIAIVARTNYIKLGFEHIKYLAIIFITVVSFFAIVQNFKIENEMKLRNSIMLIKTSDLSKEDINSTISELESYKEELLKIDVEFLLSFTGIISMIAILILIVSDTFHIRNKTKAIKISSRGGNKKIDFLKIR